jgi:hypothetical protein
VPEFLLVEPRPQRQMVGPIEGKVLRDANAPIAEHNTRLLDSGIAGLYAFSDDGIESNEETVRLSGVNVKLVKMVVF